MSGFREAKHEFRKTVLRDGALNVDALRSAWYFQQAGEDRIRRWLNNFHSPVSISFSQQRRLINRYMLGADPELVVGYEHSTDGFQRVDAGKAGLQLIAGKAFGADNNDRLLELRPTPSRFAVDVVASIWITMRWLQVDILQRYGQRHDLVWKSEPFIANDGVGGHIHFGRKRWDKEKAIESLQGKAVPKPQGFDGLDVIASTCYAAGLFPKDFLALRVKGKYGHQSDFRLQSHGYEYRTLPSWLDSPRLTHLMLTLGKLALLTPELLKWPAGNTLSQGDARRKLMSLLAYYKGMDDDAAIALRAIGREGFPALLGGDIRPRWAISPQTCVPSQKVTYFPEAIEGDSAHKAVIFANLHDGKGLDALPLEPSWTPANLPRGYVVAAQRTYTAPGIGETFGCLVVPDNGIVSAQRYDNKGQVFVHLDGQLYDTAAILDEFKKNLPPKLRQSVLLGNVGGGGCVLQAGENWTQSKWTRKKLQNACLAALPFYRPVADLKNDEFQKWQARFKRREGQPAATPKSWLRGVQL